MANRNGRPAQNGGGPAKQPQAQPPQRPVHEVRIGRVKAAIWQNDGQYGMRYAVKVSKVYKADENGEAKWQTTEVFGGEDLLALAKVLDLAHTWIHENTTGIDLPF